MRLFERWKFGTVSSCSDAEPVPIMPLGQVIQKKLELEVTESNSKIEELQGVLDSTNFEITAFLKFFNELSKMRLDAASDASATFGSVDHLPHIDDTDELDIHKMEEARLTYIAAVATAKENPSEESLAAATEDSDGILCLSVKVLYEA
ncbi:protein MICROTUBULE BINDING PROTEIN 2C-like [Zingiber officinale]|uniref:protein MICROTUBULE BINDING PROTEIN 2C-like n=1 Tax=Zingiber officinale TaxID=94328 RepID=UPI001C4D8CC8|nr:protein MICROTUBULE BINDING PROTEIN 2C-like [Zingiber officinale]